VCTVRCLTQGHLLERCSGQDLNRCLHGYRALTLPLLNTADFQELVDEEEDCGKRDPPPMMVPVADLLNHVTENNARLEFTPVRGLAVSLTRYGQMANWQLLHMYGFSEPHPHNASETADIRMWTLHRAALQGEGTSGWHFPSSYPPLAQGLRTCLKVLCMSEEKFAEYKENEGWEEDEEEPPLMLEDLSDLPAWWRKLLHTSTSDGLETKQAALTDTAAYVVLSARERHAIQVRYGQKLILQATCPLQHTTSFY
uniref:Rubisco LSMT substrate-binding domain-containing protein n=1 Tax=Leptobrachium leishanense TaxID=445787 RepID=A0A8C5WJP1_9ANUR